VGLIVPHGERLVRGRPETIYSTVARRLYTDPRQSSPAYLAAYRRSTAALLRLAERQLGAAIERQERDRSTRPISLRAMQVQPRLSRSAQRELARRLDEVLAFLAVNDDPEEGQRVAVTLVSAPVEDRRDSTGTR
jgi:hypothetical protein